MKIVMAIEKAEIASRLVSGGEAADRLAVIDSKFIVDIDGGFWSGSDKTGHMVRNRTLL